MNILSDKEIYEYHKSKNIFQEGTFVKENLRPANYDLRIGQKYINISPLNGTDKGEFTESEQLIHIDPYGLLFLHSEEILKMPKELVGHIQSTFRLATKGLGVIHSNQVEPGHDGIVVIIIYNYSNTRQKIRRNSSIATLEFSKLSDVESSFEWSKTYPGVQNGTLRNMHALISDPPTTNEIPFLTHNDLKNELDQFQLNQRSYYKPIIRKETLEFLKVQDQETKKSRRFIISLIITSLIALLSLIISVISNFDSIKSMFE